MTDPTSLSTNQSELQETKNPSLEVEVLNEKSQQPQNVATLLSAIPVFNKPTLASSVNQVTLGSEPSLCENEQENFQSGEQPSKFEYEFTNLFEGCLYFVYLYDTNDISACERILHRPVTQSEISYSSTGNGFVRDDDFKYTFQKKPFTRSWSTHADIKQGVLDEATQTRRRQSIKVRTAEDVLSSL